MMIEGLAQGQTITTRFIQSFCVHDNQSLHMRALRDATNTLGLSNIRGHAVCFCQCGESDIEQFLTGTNRKNEVQENHILLWIEISGRKTFTGEKVAQAEKVAQSICS